MSDEVKEFLDGCDSFLMLDNLREYEVEASREDIEAYLKFSYRSYILDIPYIDHPLVIAGPKYILCVGYNDYTEIQEKPEIMD